MPEIVFAALARAPTSAYLSAAEVRALFAVRELPARIVQRIAGFRQPNSGRRRSVVLRCAEPELRRKRLAATACSLAQPPAVLSLGSVHADVCLIR
jgi:hypothetical protein